LLIISEKRTTPFPGPSLTRPCKRQERKPGPAEIKEIPDPGHSLTIDHGWLDVADTGLEFIERNGWQCVAEPD
jgi:non-heme chloroperoxidase